MIAFVVSLCMATAVFLLTRTLLVGGKAPSSAWRDATLGRERSMKETNARQSRKQVGLRSRSLLERLARVPPRLNAPADRLVATAGLSDRFTGSWVVGISAVSGAVLLLLVAVGVGHDGFTSRELMLAPLAALLGLAAPWMLISGRATRRKEAIERALPDTLDLITVSIEAGLAVEAAMKRVSDRLRGPLAEEIRRMLAEIGLGRRRPDALHAMAMRSGVPEVAQLVNAINQADRSGMQLGPVLRTQSQQVRQRRRQRAEEKALQAPLKMLFPLVLFIFPAIFLVIMGPAVITLMEQLG